MDGRTDPLNDAALEQEIEALLSVEPSADFVARVRSRVAEESMSSGWGWRWPLAAVATGVAAIAIGVVLWRTADTTTRPTSTAPPRVAVVDQPRPAIVSPRQAPVAVPPVAVPLRHEIRNGAAAPHRAIEIALPPVIIAENETAAFAVLVRTAPTTRFDFATAEPVMKSVEVDEIPRVQPVALKPLEIEPLVKVVELE